MTKKVFLILLVLILCTQVSYAGDYTKYYQNLPTEVRPVENVVIPANEVTLTETGGIGDGITLCTEAFTKGISKLTKMGGGRLTVPQGVWITGPIMLKDNIELHLNRNAIVIFSPDKRLYVNENSNRVFPCIRASKRKNIAITGQGILDGGGQLWRPVKRGKMSDVEWKQYLALGGETSENGDLWYPWQLNNGYPDIADTPKAQEAMRNDLIRLTDCENVLVEGVTIQNSPRFHLHPCYCKNVIIDGVTVRSEWNVQNGDGIDLSDCHQALIVNSTVSVGDDGICLKSSIPAPNRIAGCEHILICDNTVFHAHGGFVLGSETAGGMRDIVVKGNCFSGTDTGLRFKSGLSRGGKTERLYVSDIMMNDIAAEAVIFQCDYVDRPAGREQGPRTFTDEQRRWAPDFQDIHIQNVVCHGCKTAIKASGIEGLDCVHDITLTNCSFVYDKEGKAVDEKSTQLKFSDVKLIENKNQ